MGNKSSVAAPSQFIVQTKADWDEQLTSVLRSKPTVIKTVILPPGVQLGDPRLKLGEVIEETKHTLKLGEKGNWPADVPFEADLDGRLLPPGWGQRGIPAHYAVYPNDRFNGVECGLCELTHTSRLHSVNR